MSEEQVESKEEAEHGKGVSCSGEEAGDAASKEGEAKEDAPAAIMEVGECQEKQSEDAEKQQSGASELKEDEKQKRSIRQVTNIWREHLQKMESEGKPVATDRLTASAEFRKWVRTADLGLEPSDAIPSFTQVWMEQNSQRTSLTIVRGSRRVELSGPGASRGKSKSSSVDDALANFAAEGNATYTSGVGKDDRGAPERRIEDQNVDRSSASNVFSHSESLQIFDEALKDLCENQGVVRGLPMNASVISGCLRRKFPHFHLSKTPFDRFKQLLEAAETEKLVKVSTRGHSVNITWVRHNVKVLDVHPGAGHSNDKREGRAEQRRRDRRDRRKDKDRLAGLAVRRRSLKSRSRERRHGAEGSHRHTRRSRSPRRDRPERRRSRERGRDQSRRPRTGRHVRSRERSASVSPSYSYSSYSYSYSDDYFDYSSYSESPERHSKRRRDDRHKKGDEKRKSRR
eukprot:TRINITY_DN43333_c0_g1_i1.p1 TRINITY_DN43333_c0_g1~~TRINITY_DN43333_c0_g1_i1.p1  ORF type:complete len:457 (-),score=74.72 TRINITY_DN43333_c0_g1_i1:73-1443(-)